MRRYLFLLVVGLPLLTSVAFGAYTVDGSTTNLDVGTGTLIDANDDPSVLKGNLFSTPELIKNQQNETLTGSVSLSMIPVVDVSGVLYFQFIYDAQEVANTGTGGNSNRELVSIDNIEIKAGPAETLIWELDASDPSERILLNNNDPVSPSYNPTATPQSAGGDFELLLPLSKFDGLGINSSDTLWFTATQSESDNGGDEWARLIDGNFFNPGEIIGPGGPGTATVPEPSSLAIFGLGAFVMMRASRRRKRRT